MATASDGELVRAARTGTREAAAELFDRHWHEAWRVARAITGLSPQRRVVVVLRYGVGLAPAAIAELLGLPLGTVHSRLARALEDLRRERAEDVQGA